MGKQKILKVRSYQDVFDNCVLGPGTNSTTRIAVSPAVPFNITKTALYSMSCVVGDTNRQYFVSLVFSGAKDYRHFNELVLEESTSAKSHPSRPVIQQEVAGDRVEAHSFALLPATYVRLKERGAHITLSGPKGSTTVTIPAFFFSAMEAFVESILKPPQYDFTPVSDYIHQGSIGTTVKSRPAASETGQPRWIAPERFPGQEFIFMPVPRADRAKAYSFDTGQAGSRRLPYEAYVGKVATVLSANRRDGGKLFFMLAIRDAGENIIVFEDLMQPLPWLAPKADLDYARSNFTGKTLWIKDRAVFSLDSSTEFSSKRTLPRLEPIVIQKVVVGSRWSPIRFIFSDSRGDEFYKDVAVSLTNTLEAYAERFEQHFFTENPRRHDWPEEIFDAISEGKACVGMLPEQVEMSWGIPKKINITLLGSGKQEQWVYGQGSYVYFEGGRCSSIQAER
jgi:hypothetical protein